MPGTTSFFVWFFQGLGGIGGWFLFFLLAIAALVFVFYNSAKRHLPVLGWRLSIILVTALMIPIIILRFSSAEIILSLQQYQEFIFYLGLIGGLLPPVLAIGYYLNFRGLMGCPNGHVYDVGLGECPECPQQGRGGYEPIPQRRGDEFGPAVIPEREHKPKVAAWLNFRGGRSYQLNAGETSIGRRSTNDIYVVTEDMTVSRDHAVIIEKNGHFRRVDKSRAGTRVNGQRVKGTILLEAGDEIQFGQSTFATFKA